MGDLEGDLTGAGMLACVILPRANRKARTKPICLWGGWARLDIFSVLLWVVKLHKRGLFGVRLAQGRRLVVDEWGEECVLVEGVAVKV